MQDKPAGAWLMRERIPAEDMAATPPMAIPIILPHQLPEDIIAAVNLGILSGKDARTALVREDTHGMDQNALHSHLLPTRPTLKGLIIILPARMSTAVPPDPIGMAVSVKRAAMKAQVGQIAQLNPKHGANLLQEAAVLALTGIMAAVPAEPLHIPAPGQPAQTVLLRPADAVRAGLTAVHALVNKLHHKDVTMCQHQAAEADFTGIPLPALAANQAQHPVQVLAVVQDRAPPDLIG